MCENQDKNIIFYRFQTFRLNFWNQIFSSDLTFTTLIFLFVIYYYSFYQGCVFGYSDLGFSGQIFQFNLANSKFCFGFDSDFCGFDLNSDNSFKLFKNLKIHYILYISQNCL